MTEEAPGPTDRAAEGGSEGVEIATAKKKKIIVNRYLSMVPSFVIFHVIHPCAVGTRALYLD